MRTPLSSSGIAAAKEPDPRDAIAPMIDIGFLLLIFFLVTATLARPDFFLGFKMVAPPPPVPVTLKVEPIRIEIAADGAISVDSERVEPAGSPHALPALIAELERRDRMTAAIGRPDGVLAIISAANASPHQRLVDVVNCLKKSGISRVTFTDDLDR
ncbi:MAG: biopolymer transporter ExbD [Verrucomicrobiales bacterium]